MIPFTVAYWDDPEKVIWVDTPVRQLRGFDNMWVADGCYGMFNDTKNYEMYDGRQSFAWTYANGVEEETWPVLPAERVVFRGWMLTTEQAEFVGIL